MDHFGLVVGKVYDGELWRIITGHLYHTNWPHLLMNVGAFGLLVFIFGQQLSLARLSVMYLVTSLGISLAYLIWFPVETRYLGLSGVVHGLAMASALWNMKRLPFLSVGVIVFFIVKLVYENSFGPSEKLAQTIGLRVATEAHVYGAVMGCTVVLAEYAQSRYMRKRSIR